MLHGKCRRHAGCFDLLTHFNIRVTAYRLFRLLTCKAQIYSMFQPINVVHVEPRQFSPALINSLFQTLTLKLSYKIIYP